MARTKFFAGLTLIFLLGALAGALGTSFYFKGHVEEFLKEGPPKNKIMHRLTRALELTREQQEKIEPIIAEAHAKIVELRQKTFPEVKRIRENSFALIKKELNEDKQEKLEYLKKRLEKHWPRRHKSPPPPPPPPRTGAKGPEKPLS